MAKDGTLKMNTTELSTERRDVRVNLFKDIWTSYGDVIDTTNANQTTAVGEQLLCYGSDGESVRLERKKDRRRTTESRVAAGVVGSWRRAGESFPSTAALKLLKLESGAATGIRKSCFFFFFQVWVVFSDGETSVTGPDTRSSWFPMRCRFGAGPSVITNFFNTRRAANKNLSRLVCICVCMFVTSVCACLRVGGEQLGVCIIDFDVRDE